MVASGKPRRIGEFRLLSELGRGGMGVVFEALQESLRRKVALKVLPAHFSMSPDSVARFRREAEAAARIRHPGIIPIFSVGEEAGVHYFAMELIEGDSLENMLKTIRGRQVWQLTLSLPQEAGSVVRPPESQTRVTRRKFSAYIRSCLELTAHVADALEAAHSVGILHRDVKPSNILVRLNGTPVLVDFGLARDSRGATLTATGDTVGTPSYMAPEQARGLRDLDERVDVYGLGATLYELLTLRPPFQGEHPAEIMRRIVDDDVVPPRKRNQTLPQEVDTMVMRAMAKEPDRRYVSAAAFREDLQRFLLGEPILAKPDSYVTRFVRSARRQRKAVVVGMLAVVVASVSFAGIVFGWRERQQSLGREDLEKARVIMRSGGYPARVSEASRLYHSAATRLSDHSLVHGRWAEDFRNAFDVLYPEGRAFLEEARKQLPEELARDKELRSLCDRIVGRGRLRLQVSPSTGAAEIRVIDPVTKQPGQLALQRARGDNHLRAGEYMIKVLAEGCWPELALLKIEPDQMITLDMRCISMRESPEGMVHVTGADPSGPGFFMDQHEVTCARYQAFLETVPEPARSELRPVDWKDDRAPAGEENDPVRGIPWHAAALYARSVGLALPDRERFVRAATAGFPWDYPWGSSFDPELATASSLQAEDDVEPVGQRPRGASPFAIMDLSGNVAEFLSPAADNQLFAAGGHFRSGPSELAVGSLEQVRWGKANRTCGFRCVFVRDELPTADSPPVASKIRELKAAILSGAGHSLSESRLDGEGTLHQSLDVAALRPPGDWIRLTVQGEAGLLAATPFRFRDQSGRNLVPLQVYPSAVEGMWDHYFALGESGRNTEILHLNATRSALPGGCIKAVRDRFEYRELVPTHATLRTFHRLILPAGARVLSVQPTPAALFRAGEEVVVLWSDLQKAAGDGGMPCIVSYRWDSAPPVYVSSAIVEGRVAEFMLRPSTVKRELPWDGKPVIVDMGMLGKVVTAEVVLGLKEDQIPDGGGHLRFFLVREGDQLEVGSFEVVPIPDGGMLTREGNSSDGFRHAYTYPEMGVRIEQAKGWQLTPLCRERTELQILLEKVNPPPLHEVGTGKEIPVRVGIEILGTYSEKSEPQAKLFRRMTLCSPRRAVVSDAIREERAVGGVRATGRTVLLEEGGGWYRMERNLLVARERVRLLVRAYVIVEDKKGAEIAFSSLEGELDSVLGLLTFERPYHRKR